MSTKNHCITYLKCVLALLPSASNLIYTHYRVCSIVGVEFSLTVLVKEMFSVGLDVLLVAFLVHILARRRMDVTAVSTFLITLLWGMANIVYATYFNGYIPLSSFSQSLSLFSLPIGEYIANSLCLSDVLYLVVLIASALFFWGRRREKRLQGSLRCMALSIIGITLLLTIWKICVYEDHFTLPNRQTISEASLLPSRERLALSSVRAIAECGFFRSLFIPAVLRDDGQISLSREQIVEIKRMIAAQDRMYSDTTLHRSPLQYSEIVFILAESYLGQIHHAGVTPFLDSLRRDSTVICNDRMTTNITLGNSSDGQYLYLTGLLPLRTEITVSAFAGKHLVSLAHILREHGYATMMTIPTSAEMWNQSLACDRYGVDNLYSVNEQESEWFDDRQLIDYAMKNEKKHSGPLFHVILTASTHGPYTEGNATFSECACCPERFPAIYSPEYCNYLRACHFMDHQLQRYVKSKDPENTLIIIASDHGWQEDKSLLPKDVSPNDISLFILNAKGRHEYYRGSINQLDVFTTVVDLLQPYNTQTALPHWYGLGRSILHPEHWTPSVTPAIWQMSRNILEGDYFRGIYKTQDESY